MSLWMAALPIVLASTPATAPSTVQRLVVGDGDRCQPSCDLQEQLFQSLCLRLPQLTVVRGEEVGTDDLLVRLERDDAAGWLLLLLRADGSELLRRALPSTDGGGSGLVETCALVVERALLRLQPEEPTPGLVEPIPLPPPEPPQGDDPPAERSWRWGLAAGVAVSVEPEPDLTSLGPLFELSLAPRSAVRIATRFSVPLGQQVAVVEPGVWDFGHIELQPWSVHLSASLCGEIAGPLSICGGPQAGLVVTQARLVSRDLRDPVDLTLNQATVGLTVGVALELPWNLRLEAALGFVGRFGGSALTVAGLPGPFYDSPRYSGDFGLTLGRSFTFF